MNFGLAALSAGEGAAAAGGRLGGFAGRMRLVPETTRPSIVAELNTPGGQSYLGRSGFTKKLHPETSSALSEVPESVRSNYHGRCGEVDAVNNAFNAGETRGTLKGSTMQTAKVRGPNSTAHGLSQEPCGSCNPLLDLLGITFIP